MELESKVRRIHAVDLLVVVVDALLRELVLERVKLLFLNRVGDGYTRLIRWHRL